MWNDLRLITGLGALALIVGMAISLRRHPQPEAKQRAAASVRRWVRRGFR